MRKLNNTLINALLNKINRIGNNKSIIFCWIPSHIGIYGNGKADSAAKASLEMNISDLKIPYSDIKPSINKYIKNKWQGEWSTFTNNKLLEIKPTIGEWEPKPKLKRKEETVITRLRIGHTNITHAHLLKKEEAPKCIPCQEAYTIKHILIHCIDLAPIRKHFYNANNLKELFEENDLINILQFLKATNLYQKI